MTVFSVILYIRPGNLGKPRRLHRENYSNKPSSSIIQEGDVQKARQSEISGYALKAETVEPLSYDVYYPGQPGQPVSAELKLESTGQVSVRMNKESVDVKSIDMVVRTIQVHTNILLSMPSGEVIFRNLAAFGDGWHSAVPGSGMVNRNNPPLISEYVISESDRHVQIRYSFAPFLLAIPKAMAPPEVSKILVTVALVNSESKLETLADFELGDMPLLLNQVLDRPE